MRKTRQPKGKKKTDKMSILLHKYPIEMFSFYVGFRYIDFKNQKLKFKVITYLLTAIVAAFLSDKYLGSNFLPKVSNFQIPVIETKNNRLKNKNNKEKLLKSLIELNNKPKYAIPRQQARKQTYQR